MAEVGTNIGRVYDTKEGFGTAAILQGDETQKQLNKLGDDAYADQNREDQQRHQKDLMELKDRQEAMKKLTDPDPDYWYKYDADINKMMDGVTEKGARVMTDGKVENPFTATDGASQDFQKDLKQVARYKAFTNQLKTHWTAGQLKLNSATDKKEYTTESIKAFESYFDRSLDEIVKEGKTPPRLIIKEPLTSITGFIADQYKDVYKGPANPKAEDIEKLVDVSLGDPVTLEKMTETYNSKFVDVLTKEENEALEGRAKANGRSKLKQAYFEDATNLAPGKPYTLSDMLDSWKKKDPRTKTSIEDPTTGQTKISERVKDVTVNAFVRGEMLANPNKLQEDVAQGLYGKAGDDVNKNIAAAQKYYNKLLKEQFPSDFTSSYVGGDKNHRGTGVSEDVYNGRAKQWLADIRAGNPEAGSFIRHIKMPGGYEVTNVEILTPEQTGNIHGMRMEMIKTATTEGYVRETPKTEVVTLDFADDEALLKYYNDAAMSQKTTYGEVRSENSQSIKDLEGNTAPGEKFFKD